MYDDYPEHADIDRAAIQPVAAHAAPLLDAPPRRVVSLVPSITESLVDLDLGSRLIAVTEACTRPAGALDHLPRVGSPSEPDYDQIAALAPDLVFLSEGVSPFDAASTLKAAGLAVWRTAPRSVSETLTLLWDIMNIFDHTAMVPRVQAIERAYDATLAASRVTRPVTVFAPRTMEPWYTFPPGTYPDSLLRVCGGRNIFHDDEALTLEDVIADEPEVVLLPEMPFSPDDVAWFAELEIPAAHTGRIHLIDGDLLTWPGTRTAYALRDLPALLAPEPVE